MKPDPIAECEICGKPFARRNTLQRVCSVLCATRVAVAAKRERVKAKRAAKAKLKTRGDWLKEAQNSFNAWIRKRDEHLPCVSCGRHHDGQYHAGHYLSTGARPELRFDPANVWKQCQPCNTHLHGNLVLYRAELIRRIGLAEVERLEGPQEPKKYTVADLKAIRDEYRAKVREST